MEPVIVFGAAVATLMLLGLVALAFTARVAAIWGIWLAAIGLIGLTVASLLALRPTGSVNGYDLLVSVASSLAAGSWATSGAFLAARVPRNPIGWLLLAGGFLFALADVGSSLISPTLPGIVWIVWAAHISWTPAVAAVGIFVPLLFPTGRLPSPRWRPLVLVTAVALLLTMAESAFSPFSPGSTPQGVQNPVAANVSFEVLLGLAGGVATIAAIVCFPLAAMSLIVRYEEAAGIERAQLRWFAAATALIGPNLAVAFVVGRATGGVGLVISNVAWLLAMAGLVLLPVAIGIAVMRYRLYDLDRLISRTLAWATLTALLAGAFAAVILLLQVVAGPLIGSNALAVAGSTLIVAALFQPLRRRVQALVDRQFDRQGYSAGREIERFGASLRDEVDIERVEALLAATVERTVEPSSASVWLRRTDG